MMKALVMREYKHLSYEDVETPKPKEGEVLVRVKACSVCGSDVHGFDGSTGRRRPPVIMGHEASGVIAACGPGVKSHKVGDRVTFDSTVYCNECEMCREARSTSVRTDRFWVFPARSTTGQGASQNMSAFQSTSCTISPTMLPMYRLPWWNLFPWRIMQPPEPQSGRVTALCSSE